MTDISKAVAEMTTDGEADPDGKLDLATLMRFDATGSTVTWTNEDSFAHSVVATDGSFISDSLGNGEAFTNTFDTAGTFSYVCGIHASMTGTVTVND